MNTNEPIVVDDPAVLALIARLAESCRCSDEEAIGIAVVAELASRKEMAGGAPSVVAAPSGGGE